MLPPLKQVMQIREFIADSGNPEWGSLLSLDPNKPNGEMTSELADLDIARALVQTVRSNVTIDWTLRENVRAQLLVLVRHILRKYGYPPDKQAQAT